jgi:hypothetical protein
MGKMQEILAKWRDKEGDDPLTWGWPRGRILPEHTGACISMLLFIFDDPVANIGKDLYAAMKLSLNVTYEEFRKLAILTILLHDVGKANKEFQTMLRRLENVYQQCLQEK